MPISSAEAHPSKPHVPAITQSTLFIPRHYALTDTPRQSNVTTIHDETVQAKTHLPFPPIRKISGTSPCPVPFPGTVSTAFLPGYIPAVPPPFSLQEPSTGGNSCIPVKCSAGNMFFHMNSGKEASFSLTGKDFCHTTAVFDNLRTITNTDLFRKEQLRPIYHRRQMSPYRFFPQRHGRLST